MDKANSIQCSATSSVDTISISLCLYVGFINSSFTRWQAHCVVTEEFSIASGIVRHSNFFFIVATTIIEENETARENNTQIVDKNIEKSFYNLQSIVRLLVQHSLRRN